MEYENIRYESTETLLYMKRGKCKNQKPRMENYFAHSMGNLPGRRMFKHPPQEMHPPWSRGRSPGPFQRGGLANAFNSSNSTSIPKPPVKVARCQNCINRIIDLNTQPNRQPNPRQLAEDANRGQARSPKPIFGCCTMVQALMFVTPPLDRCARTPKLQRDSKRFTI
jgi:hypothetical protein